MKKQELSLNEIEEQISKLKELKKEIIKKEREDIKKLKPEVSSILGNYIINNCGGVTWNKIDWSHIVNILSKSIEEIQKFDIKNVSAIKSIKDLKTAIKDQKNKVVS